MDTPHVELPARRSRADDVVSIFNLLLGRSPEGLDVIEFQTQFPVDDIVFGTMESEEFVSLAGMARERQALPHDHNLGDAEFEDAARWLAGRTGNHLLAESRSWWVLLDEMAQAFNLRDLPSRLGDGLAAFVDVVSRRAQIDNAHVGALSQFLTVDEAWYRRANRDADVAIGGGVFADVAAYFMAFGARRGDQLLPMFSDGVGEMQVAVLRRPEPAIAMIVSGVLDRARSGEATHWLFSIPHYQQSLRWQGDADRPQSYASAAPYLDFLLYGEARRHAPHPLFCHAAYAQLNDFAPEDATFRHYAVDGMFADRATSTMFDAEYYYLCHPDARSAVLSGAYHCALHHFLRVGVHKDYRFSPEFDLKFYGETFGDAREAVASGTASSLTWHFVHVGLGEGRAPNPYFDAHFYEQRYPDSVEERHRLGIRTAIEHFLLLGRRRGYGGELPLGERVPVLDQSKVVFHRRAIRSYDRLLRNALDFRDFAGDPQISLIVPVCGEAHFTALLLESAYYAASHLFHRHSAGSEIVVVDNGSRDGTADLLSRTMGVVTVRHPGPIGFPRAINAGLEVARGRIVIVANNDIEFLPDTFAAVLRQFDHGDDIGLLGGMILLPDETIQEAGSYIDRAAGVAGLGRAENPWDAYFRGTHDADYCTGSFFAIRTSDFRDLGGLDEAYSPGYYEEVDLACRMRDRLGKRVVVTSDIQITHFEHASFGKGRPPSVAFPAIERNRRLYAGRHRPRLQAYPAPSRLRTAGEVRPAAIGRTRWLLIQDRLSGDEMDRASQLTASLNALDIPFDILALDPGRTTHHYDDPRVNVLRAWEAGDALPEIWGRAANRYSHVLVCGLGLLDRLAPHLVVLGTEQDITIVCDTGDLGLLFPMVGAADMPDRLRLAVPAGVDIGAWLTPTASEAAFLEEAGFTAVSPTAFRLTAPVLPPNGSVPHRLLVLCSVDRPGSPAHDGVHWLLDCILPLCPVASEQLRVTIVGDWDERVRADFIARHAEMAIDFADGAISGALLAETRLAVSPERFGSGPPASVLALMAADVPVVLGETLFDRLTGDRASFAGPLAVADVDDDGHSFATWIERLATDPEARESLRDAQRRFAEPFTDAATFDAGLGRFLQERVGRPAQR